MNKLSKKTKNVRPVIIGAHVNTIHHMYAADLMLADAIADAREPRIMVYR